MSKEQVKKLVLDCGSFELTFLNAKDDKFVKEFGYNYVTIKRKYKHPESNALLGSFQIALKDIKPLIASLNTFTAHLDPFSIQTEDRKQKLVSTNPDDFAMLYKVLNDKKMDSLERLKKDITKHEREYILKQNEVLVKFERQLLDMVKR